MSELAWPAALGGLDGRISILLLALVLDALVGDPEWLWRRAPHPAVLMGRSVDWLESRLNREAWSAGTRRLAGILALALLVLCVGLLGWLGHEALGGLSWGWALEALIVAVLLAQRSLFEHVLAVARGFETGGLAAARIEVAKIVGRDPESLDEAGVCRAAIESAAENYADGVVAPALWYLLLGLPGILIYKVVNTADSMIGHRTRRHEAFGWASARFDDLLNLLPARLTALALVAASLLVRSRDGGPKAALRALLRDAPRHRSPNAGWPEAAAAGALGLALAGPRRYGETLVEDAWMNRDGDPDATPQDIRRALRLVVLAGLLQSLLVVTAVMIDLR